VIREHSHGFGYVREVSSRWERRVIDRAWAEGLARERIEAWNADHLERIPHKAP
jgi:hypothetical protein